MKEKDTNHPFGKLAKTTQRALANAGIQSLEELSRISEAELMQWHGICKNALQSLKTAMEAQHLSFASTKSN